MSRITRVGRVMVPVRDQDAAIAFYTETLGFELIADVPFGAVDRWVEVATHAGGAALALVPPQGEYQAGRRAGIALETTDARAAHEELKANGVSDDHVLRPGGAVHEVPLPQRPLLALDDEQRLTREHEKVFLVGFPVVHRHRLIGPEHDEADSDLGEVRFALKAQTVTPPLAVAPARCTSVQDEPSSPAAASPASVCSSGASGTIVGS